MDWTITQVASVVLFAMGGGFLFSCFGHTPVLGYIIAGLLLGPSGFALISNYNSITLCSELGIIFLLFVIGQSLSFEKIKNIWKTSVAITIASTLTTCLILVLIGFIFHISMNLIILFSFCIALSSTAITVQSLNTLKDKDDSVSETTIGILIAQDLIALIMVIIINMMASNGAQVQVHHKFSNLFGLSIFLGGGLLFAYYYQHYSVRVINFIQKHKDMTSITVFGICLGSAVLAELIGFSGPFGAFIAGLLLGNSSLKETVKSVSQPIEEILLMTFFLSVGLMVDLNYIWDNVMVILAALFYVTIGKTALNIGLLRLFKFPLKDSFIISVLLGHIGEFSFMLAFSASKVGLIGVAELKFLVSLTALSLFISPFWLIFAERCRQLTTQASNNAWEIIRLVMKREVNKIRKGIQFIKDLVIPFVSMLRLKIKLLYSDIRGLIKK